MVEIAREIYMDDFLSPFGERRQTIHQFIVANQLDNVDMLLAQANGTSVHDLTHEFIEDGLDRKNARILAGRIYSLSKLLTNYSI